VCASCGWLYFSRRSATGLPAGLLVYDDAANTSSGRLFHTVSVWRAARTRLVKIFMRRDCSIGVSRRDVLDSGYHVAHRAQAEQGRGRAERCSCLGGCVLGDNAPGTGSALSLKDGPRTGSDGTGTPL
jgi:hypothetical protein